MGQNLFDFIFLDFLDPMGGLPIGPYLANRLFACTHRYFGHIVLRIFQEVQELHQMQVSRELELMQWQKCYCSN